LKETDLENLSYAQFKGVSEKLFIEPENEDEMRRVVLIQLARMAVRGDWNGFLTGGGGSGGAPTTAEYVVMSLNGTLTNERVLTAGARITITDSGANDKVTISADASPVTSLIAGTNISLSPGDGLGDVTITATGSGGAPTSAQYVTLATDGTLTNERVLTAGSGITLTDGGAGSTITIAASGGGGGSTPKFSGVKANANAYYDLSAYPTGWRTTTYTNITETQSAPIYCPFTCGMDLTLATLGIQVSGAGDAGLNYLLAIYSVDAAGLPDSKLVSATVSADATGTQTGTITESSAGDGDLVAGTQYYYAYTQSFDATTNPDLRGGSAQFHGSFTDSTIGTQRQAIRAGAQGTLPATYPGSGVVLGVSTAIVGCTYG
jgi:hypothetical protein